MLGMTVAQEVERFFVGPGWVANHYGVARHEVYRAIADGRLRAVRVRGARQRVSLILDVRDLPTDFPRG